MIRWMPLVRALKVLMELAMVALALSCKGGGEPAPDPPPPDDPDNTAPPPRITSVVHEELLAPDQTCHWQVTWEDGQAPFTIEMQLGGGTDGNIAAGTLAQSPYAAQFTAINALVSAAATYGYTITVTDSSGRFARSIGEYKVGARLAAGLSIAVPLAMEGGAPAQWRIDWQGGTAPYSIEMELGLGCTSGTVTRQLPAGPCSWLLTMCNDSRTTSAQYAYAATVTDKFGATATASGAYSVGPLVNSIPRVVNATYHEAFHQLEVLANDADPDAQLTICVTLPGELTADSASKTAAADGSARFAVDCSDVFTGGAGNAEVYATDERGASSASTYVFVRVGAFELQYDTLYAVPAKKTAAVGEAVTVVVLTGAPEHPFAFLNGVGLVMPEDALLVGGSFNAGAVGGAADFADGVWAAMEPLGGLLIPSAGMVCITPLPEGGKRYDLSMVPLAGGQISYPRGALFNLRFTFTTPGEKRIGFQQTDGKIKRTYYSDFLNTEYCWSDISNATAPMLTVR